MSIEAGPFTYEWNENWVDVPKTDGWAHHGLAVSRDGLIVSGDAKEPKVLFIKPDGSVVRSVDVPVTETHGIALSEEDGNEGDRHERDGVAQGAPAGGLVADHEVHHREAGAGVVVLADDGDGPEVRRGPQKHDAKQQPGAE